MLPEEDEDEDYDLYINISYQGLGAILMHKGKVIIYVSCLLKYETKYLTHNLELVFMVFVFKIW